MKPTDMHDPAKYSAYYAFATEGGRIGIVTCLRCGAAIILGQEEGIKLHDAFHDAFPAAHAPAQADGGER